MQTLLIVSTLVVLATAQSIDWVKVDLAADAVIDTPPINVASQTVSLEPPAAASSDGVVVTSAVHLAQRDLGQRNPVLKRDGDCAPQPSGTGPQVSTQVSFRLLS